MTDPLSGDALAAAALRALVGLSPDTVRVLDASGRIVAASDGTPETLRALWDRDRPSRVGGAPLGFPEHPGMRALAGFSAAGERFTVRDPDGASSRTLAVWAAPVRDAAGRVAGAVLVERDVTDQAASQQQVAELERRAAAHEARLEAMVDERSRDRIAMQEERSHDRRLAAVGQLAAGVMHDVNNALNPIMAAAYLLRVHADSPDAVRDYAERIRMAAETGAATASRVGRFIRQEPVHPGGDESIDLSALAEAIIDLTEPMRLRRSSESGRVRVARALAPDVHTRGIPGEIREALLNLVQNAIDAMPNGGLLTVRTFVDGSDACVTIEDTGVGMSDETREHAFEPFFTTKGAGGSGLGLAEVYGIARRHRGSASIESSPGAGTAVTLRFPAEAPAVPAESDVVRAPTEPLHVLVVEDHDDGREFLRRLLQSEGHTVVTASTCAEARERLASPGETGYHLMLTDVGLPDGSGWELATYARETMPGLRIGVITGWEPMVGSSEARGAEFVLRKPLRAAELLSHIAGQGSPGTTDA